jgi:hypothetical protein
VTSKGACSLPVVEFEGPYLKPLSMLRSLFETRRAQVPPGSPRVGSLASLSSTAKRDPSPASSVITSRRTSMDLGLGGMMMSPRHPPASVNQVQPPSHPLTSFPNPRHIAEAQGCDSARAKNQRDERCVFTAGYSQPTAPWVEAVNHTTLTVLCMSASGGAGGGAAGGGLGQTNGDRGADRGEGADAADAGCGGST